MNSKKGILDSFFGISESGSSMRTEILAGITTFITVAYILILNPQVLSDPFSIMGQAEYAERISNGVFIGTCIGAFIGTFLCAVYARVPLMQAPGMGLNAFFAYTVVLSMGYSYNDALFIVFLSGLLFIFITICGLRTAIINSIPAAVKHAISPGIGLFITIIGLKNSGIVVSNSSTLVSMIDFSGWMKLDMAAYFNGSLVASDPEAAALAGSIMSAVTALIGFAVISVLYIRKVKGSVLIGIIASTIIGIPLGVTHLSNFDLNIASKFKDFAEVSLFKIGWSGFFDGRPAAEAVFTIIMLVISFSLVNMFDSMGTLMGAARQSGLIDKNGEIIRMHEAMLSDAISTATGALVGTSTVTTMVESSAGIAEGGRTGMTSLVTSLLFIAAIILAPVVSIVPSAATAPALIFVGVLMLSNIKDVDFSDMTDAVPSFCTIIFMPFTYSIANGIAMGLISFCIIKLCSGKAREIKPLAVIIALVFICRYAFMTQ